MSIETVPDSGYYSISNVSVQSSITTATDDTVSIQKMPDYTYFRSLWWTEGNIHPEAKWEEAKLPYVLVEGVTLEEYERRTDEFNVHGLWEWTNYKVSVYELPLKPHETCISAIIKYFNKSCGDADDTNARIIGFGATRTRDDNSGKEADASFRPRKPRVPAPSGSDGENEPWPNIVVEVACSESIDHVFEKVKNYWLMDFSRVHDAIVIKIDPVPENRMPSRMQAWHFCSRNRIRRGADLPHRTHFEFGTHDGAGNPLNIPRGVCLIKIDLDCLYYQARSDVRIPRHILPDPIVLDFSIIREEIFYAYDV
ncbi:8615_t:CDS:2 [Diversispora eburnea]|uniref:8615_t:CDS:1 n=2 Tax=Diversisporales TaxID=214509 RepID=A0A9N9DA42_9GLOM|nr:8615_t:CDS:2 [Diversispora eburnea]